MLKNKNTNECDDNRKNNAPLGCIPPRESIEKNNNAKHSTAESKHRLWWRKYREGVPTIITLGIFFVLLFQTIIFHSQLINQNRAWVTVSKVSLEEIKKGEKITASVQFINSGNTPALNVTIHNAIALRDKPVPVPMELPPLDSQQSKAVIGPRFGHKSSVTLDKIMTENIIKKIEKAEKHIYLLGVIKYDDIFGHHRETGYCFRKRPGEAGLHVSPDNNYAK